MPIIHKRGAAEPIHDEAEHAETYTAFIYKARWFVLAQTDGEELKPLPIPGWDAEQALTNLNIERIVFDLTDGNVQGFARGRQLAVNPVAQLPHKTLFHEAAHIVWATVPREISRTLRRRRALCERLKPKPWRCCAASVWALKARIPRGYLQNWLHRGSGLHADAIPDKSAQKILRAADQIIRAGRSEAAASAA